MVEGAETMKQCPNCGTVNQNNAKRCVGCGDIFMTQRMDNIRDDMSDKI